MFRRIELRLPFALAGLALTLLASPAIANWTALPGAVQLSAVSAHLKVATAPDGQGGMFVAWDDSVGTPDNQPVKIQLIDRNGVAQWSPGGITVDFGSVVGTGVDVCSDNSGGVYVSWMRFEDNPFLNFMGYRVRVTHLDASGAVSFGFPQSLNSDPDVRSSAIASDGANGAIVTWLDKENQTTGCGPFLTLWGQRVNGFGIQLWGAGGVRVSPVGDVGTNIADVRALRTAASGSGAYVVWTEACTPYFGIQSLKIQRLDLSTGQPTFDPGGLEFHDGQLPGAPTAYVIPTNGGDCLATVVDPGGDVKTYRISSNGSTAWDQALDYVDADGGAVAPDGQGGEIVSWFDAFDGEMVQRVDANGQMQFPQLSNHDMGTRCGDNTFEPIGYPACVVSDGKGGAIVATPCNHASNPFRELFAQGVNNAGRAAFRASGLQLSVIAQSASYVSGCPGFINNALFAWGNGNGVWAQQVTLSNLDVLTTPPGWANNLVPRASAGATGNSVGATVLIEGNTTWLNWAVLQRGPNPTAAFQSRVYLDGNPTSNMFWGQDVADGANPGYKKTLNFGPFNIPGGPHTLTLYADEEFGPDFSIDEASEADDVWSHQWIWEPAGVVTPGPESGAGLSGYKGDSTPPNGFGRKFMVPGAAAGAANAWVASLAARRGPTIDSSGGVLSYGDSYGLMLYDLPAGAGEFTHLIGESHQPYNGTNFIVSMVPDLPDSLYPLEVRDSTADATPDSSQFDLEFAGTRAGAGDGSSWAGQVMAPGEMADVYVLTASPGQALHLTLTRRETPAGGDRPLAFEVFPPAAAGGPAVFARGGGLAAQPASADAETLTFVAPQAGPNLVVVYRPNGTNAGAPLTYDFQSSGTQTLDAPAPPKRLEFAFAGAEPNPVRTGAEFAFTVPEAGAASLVLYDVNGRVVRDLVHGALDAGVHRVRWDGRGADGSRLGAGLYFARFTCGGRTSAHRVAVVP